MTAIARAHTTIGFVWALLGMTLGIYMAASHDHGQHVTHAHILLVGFVVPLLYGMVYRVWVGDAPASWLAKAQVVLRHAAGVVLVVGLFALYGGMADPAKLEPFLASASVVVLVSAALMFVVYLKGAAKGAAK